MTRTMMDALHIDNLPDVGWDLLACYVNGALPASAQNYATARLRFPHAQILTITVNGALTTADICDCETGDYTPSAAVAWASFMVRQGRRPTVYASRSTWPQVVAQLPGRGLTTADVDWWASTLDNTMGPEVVCTDSLTYRAVAVQFHDTGGYDISTVYDDTWHPAPSPPTPAPAPPVQLGDNVQVVPFSITTDAAGMAALGIDLPAGATKDQVCGVVMDCASAFDPGGRWWFATGEVDFSVNEPGKATVVVKGDPTHFFSGRVFVATP